jgi:4-hydroxy-3-polyprenylbenzoate decarboxylase
VTTDLPIPATAEIAIEGEILSPEVETRPEGPFGEFTGYYARGKRQEPILRVNAILHRNDPIIQGNPPSRFPAVFTFSHIRRAAMVWDDLDKQVPGVRGVWIVDDASSLGILVISLKQQYPGHAQQAALLAAGTRAGNRFAFIIIVDEDIDPSNLSQVHWAIATRVDPETAIQISGGRIGGTMFPALSPEKRERGDFTISRAIILACKPYHWIKDFPPSIETSPELAGRIKEKWKELFS